MSARRAPWAATVLTIFPEMFPGPLGHSLAGRALEQGIWSLEALSLRISPAIATTASTTCRSAAAPG